MPEGDTVRRLADRISRRFLGQVCERSTARDPRIAHLDLAGRRLVDVDAHGKWLLLRFDDDRTVYGHLRMDGKWEVGRRATQPEWQRRLELRMENGWLTAIDMPIIGSVATAKEHSVIGHLGPDLCRPETPDIDLICERLHSNGDRPLAGALLDQRNVAGFGNLYAVEVPFIAGVSPFQHVDAIGDLKALVACGAALIRTNAERGPQNTTGRRLHTSHHWIYGRKGRLCPWCSTTPLDGAGELDTAWQRVTTWCPSCQPVGERVNVDPTRIVAAMCLHPARRSMFAPGG